MISHLLMLLLLANGHAAPSAMSALCDEVYASRTVLCIHNEHGASISSEIGYSPSHATAVDSTSTLELTLTLDELKRDQRCRIVPFADLTMMLDVQKRQVHLSSLIQPILAEGGNSRLAHLSGVLLI